MRILCLLLLLVAPARGQWYRFVPPGAVDSPSILTDVVSHCTPEGARRMYAANKATYCHEATHEVNSRVRQCMRSGWGGFYVGRHRVYVLKNPNVRLSQIARYVDPSQRDSTYQLYLVQQRRDWDDTPTYVLDEWSAYVNGLQCAIEYRQQMDIKSDLKHARQFAHFADCLVRATSDLDPQYSQMRELQEFVGFQKVRIVGLTQGVQSW